MEKCYDLVAPHYDACYKDKVSLIEDQTIKILLTPLVFGSSDVLDVGCGTGLYLELFGNVDTDYVGIDPSGGMLDVLYTKFPKAYTQQQKFEEYDADLSNWLVVSLYGGVSYINPKAIDLSMFGGYFLMFYQEEHILKCFNGSDMKLLHRYMLSEYNLQGAYIYKFSNYYIVTSRELCHESLQRC